MSGASDVVVEGEVVVEDDAQIEADDVVGAVAINAEDPVPSFFARGSPNDDVMDPTLRESRTSQSALVSIEAEHDDEGHVGEGVTVSRWDS